MAVEKSFLPLPEGMKESDEDRPYDWSVKPVASDPYFDNLMFAYDSGIKLDSRQKLQTVVDQCEKNKAGLVIFDALTYMFNGDENDKQNMAVVVDGLKAIRSTGASVMYLVHLRKDDDDTDIDKVLRGHTILRDSYDLHLACRRPKGRDCIALHARYRDGKRRKFELFWRIPDEGSMGPVELDLTDVTDSDKKEKAAATDTISILLSKGWTRGIAYGIEKLAKDLGITVGKAQEVKAELLTKGTLRYAPDGASLVIA